MRQTWDPTIPAVLMAGAMLAVTVAATGGLTPGEWRAELRGQGSYVRLDLCPAIPSTHMRFSLDVEPRELEGFDAAAMSRKGAPVKFSWPRDAGRFVLEGEGGRRPKGTLQFEPNAGFVERWKALEFKELAPDDGPCLAVAGVRLADAEKLHELGYRGVTAEEMIGLVNSSVSMDWVSAMQGLRSQPDIGELIRLSHHGVTLEEIRAFSEAGLSGLAVEPLMRLHNHGVDARYVRGVIDAGIEADNIEGILRLHSHGITPEYVAAIKRAGLPDSSIDDITRLHGHGVSAEYLAGAVASGITDLSVDSVTRLHSHDVSPELARAFVEAGPGKRGVDAVVLLRNHGINADWARGMAAAGYGETRPEDLARLYSHGVTPELVRMLATNRKTRLSVDEVIRAATRGPEALTAQD